MHERFKHGEGKVAGTIEKIQVDVYAIHLDLHVITHAASILQ